MFHIMAGVAGLYVKLRAVAPVQSDQRFDALLPCSSSSKNVLGATCKKHLKVLQVFRSYTEGVILSVFNW